MPSSFDRFDDLPSGSITRRTFLSLSASAGVSLFAGDGSTVVAHAETSDSESSPAADKALINDSLGREVLVPSRIESVVPARPGVQSFLLAVCPEKVRALAYEPHDFEARANYPENLPIVGALFRRSSRGIQDAFSILPPDVLVDIENESDWAAGVADDLQLRSGLPVVTIKRSLVELPQTFRDLDLVVGSDRGETLACYIERIHEEIASSVSSIASEDKPRVLFCNKEMNYEFNQGQRMLQKSLIELAGGIDVFPDEFERSSYGASLSPEELACDVIVVPNSETKNAFLDTEDIRSLPWTHSPAIRKERVYCFEPANVGSSAGMPILTWGVIGLQWLFQKLHPNKAVFDLQERLTEFENIFFGEMENEQKQ